MSDAPIDVERDAEVVGEVLREYAANLAEYNAEMMTALPAVSRLEKGTAPVGSTWDYSRLAWILDRFEMINRPLQRILSRGSGLVESSPIMSRTRDVLELRMRELESQLHHAERQTLDLHILMGKGKHAQEVAKLRYAAGLPGDRNLVARRA